MLGMTLYRLVSMPFVQTALVYISFFIFVTPIYQQVDDVNTTRMISGAYTGTPLKYVYQIHVLLSHFLAALYHLRADINWYTLFAYASLFLSLYAVRIFLVPFVKKNNVLGAELVVCVLLIYIHAVAQFQYVTIAGLCAMSGLVLLSSQARSGLLSKPMMFLSLVLVVIGCMLRDRMAYLALILALPSMVFIYRSAAAKTKKYLKVYLGAVVCILVLLGVSNSVAYRMNPDLKADREWFDTQIDFSSFDIYAYRFNPDVYKKAGWSGNDFEMFNSWSYEDEKIFSRSDLAAIMSGAVQAPPTQQYLGFVGSVLRQNLFQSGSFYLLSAYILLVICCVLFKKERLVFGMTIMVLTIVFAYFSYFGRLIPYRVGIPAAFFICGMVCAVSRESIAVRIGRAGAGLYLIMFLVLAMTGYVVYLESKDNTAKIARFQKILEQLPKKDRALVFIWDSSIPFHWMSPFDDFSNMGEYALAGGGWPQRLAPERELFRRYGVQNLYTDLYVKDKVLLVANEDYLQYYQTFMKEHYKADTGYKVLSDFTKYETEPRYGFGGKLVKIYKK